MNTKNAEIVQVKGNTYAARSDTNHWVIMDTNPKVGGHGGGSTPKELLLYSLGGCTSSDVVSILQKKRVNLYHYEIYLKAKESDENPKVFTEIHMEYVFYGEGIKETDVEQAIKLSTEKYCGVSAMLSHSVKLTHTYRIESPEKKNIERK